MLFAVNFQVSCQQVVTCQLPLSSAVAILIKNIVGCDLQFVRLNNCSEVESETFVRLVAKLKHRQCYC